MIPRRFLFACVALVFVIVFSVLLSAFHDVMSSSSSETTDKIPVASSAPTIAPAERATLEHVLSRQQQPIAARSALPRQPKSAVAAAASQLSSSSSPPRASRNLSAELQAILTQNLWKSHSAVPLPLSVDGVWKPTRCLEFSKMRGVCLFWSEGRFDPPLNAAKIRAEARELLAIKKAGGSSNRRSSNFIVNPANSDEKRFSSPFATAVSKECSFAQLNNRRFQFYPRTAPNQTIRHKDKCGLVTATRNDVLVSWMAATVRINERNAVDDMARRAAEQEEEHAAAAAAGADATTTTATTAAANANFDPQSHFLHQQQQQQPTQLQPYPKLLFRADSLGRNKASNFVSIIRDWPYNLDRGHHGLHLYVVTTHRDVWMFRDSNIKHAQTWRVPSDKMWKTGSATCDFPTASSSSSSSSSLVELNKTVGEEILLVVQYCSHLGVERPVSVPRPLSQWTSIFIGTCCWDHGFHSLSRYVGFFTSALLLSERLPAGSFLFLDGWSTGDAKGDKQSPMRGQRIHAKRTVYEAFAKLVTERGRATVIFNDVAALSQRAEAQTADIVPLDDAGHYSCIVRPHVELCLGTLPMAGKDKWLANPNVKGIEREQFSLGSAENAARAKCTDPFNRALLQIYATYARGMLPVDKPIQRWAQEDVLNRAGIISGNNNNNNNNNQGKPQQSRKSIVAAAWMEFVNRNSVSANDVAVSKMELEQLQPHLLSAADIYYAWRLASSLSNLHFTLMLGSEQQQQKKKGGAHNDNSSSAACSTATSDAAAQKYARSIATNNTFVCELHPALSRSQLQWQHAAVVPATATTASSISGPERDQFQFVQAACQRLVDAFEKDALALLGLAESWVSHGATSSSSSSNSKSRLHRHQQHRHTSSSSSSAPFTEADLHATLLPAMKGECNKSFHRAGLAALYTRACQRLSELFSAVPLKRYFEGPLLRMTVDDLRLRLASWKVMGMLGKMEI